MQKVSRFFQIFFKVALIFLFVFIWVRYFVRSLLWSIVITTAITLVIDFVTVFISRKKHAALSMKKEEREKAENMFLSLSLDPKAIDFFAKLASKKHKCEKKKDCVVVLHSDGKKVLIFPHLSHNALTPQDLAHIACKANALSPEKVVVPCGESTKEAFSFAKNFEYEIIILDQYSTYQKLYKPYDVFPPITTSYKKDKRLAFKDLAMFSLNRSRAKGYFLSALILTISTLFVRATIYYCVVASILIVLALVSLFNPFERNVKTKEIL